MSDDSDLLGEYRKLTTASVSDAMGNQNATLSYMRPLIDGVTIAGRAVTVRTGPGDPRKPTEAIEQARPGDVIVIEARSSEESACWGGGDSTGSFHRGLSGAVVDGAIRDVAAIRALGFPVWARSITPKTGEPTGVGEINVQIQCGGVIVNPGDIVIADDDGVAVVPAQEAESVLQRSIEREAAEQAVMQEIRNGLGILEALDVVRAGREEHH